MDEVREDGHRTEQGREREVRPVADAVPASIAGADDPERAGCDDQIEEHLERPATLRVIGEEAEEVVVGSDEDRIGRERDEGDQRDGGGGGTRHGSLRRGRGVGRVGEAAARERATTVRRLAVGFAGSSDRRRAGP
jgi:hypothetical protein